MRRIALALTALLACREPNPAFVADDTASTTGDVSTSTTDGSISGDSSDSIADASTTSATATTHESATSDPDTSSSTSGAESTTESTGAPASDPYPACDPRADPPCPRDFPECVAVSQVGWCTQFCDVDEDCPAPLTGDPTVVCAGPDGNQCALDCGDGETCPDEMSCVEVVNNIFRCVWPV